MMNELDAALGESAQKLKRTFLSIFERYNRNFDDESDEIDLSSLAIVKNNGHLLYNDKQHQLIVDYSDSMYGKGDNSPLAEKLNRNFARSMFTSSNAANSSPLKPKTQIIFLSKLSVKDFPFESFDDVELYLIYSEWMKEIRWDSLKNDEWLSCPKHTQCNGDCFECLLELIIECVTIA